MKNKTSGAKTLMWSVIMSSPAPIVVGLSLINGHSSTQIADFLRRTSEFIAIIMSFIVYKMTEKKEFCDVEYKAKLEKIANVFVGILMCMCGALMCAVAILNGAGEDKGSIIPSLVIVGISLISNSFFFVRYTTLYKSKGNVILKTQSRLYRAKCLVDGCVLAALIILLAAPESRLAYWTDMVGSFAVAVYLTLCGIRTVKESLVQTCEVDE